jgi:glycosyltransferase involved in cell wall biosynthesis
MIEVKRRMGSRVRIVSAGENWDPAEYGLEGVIENLGILDYADTPKLYRESDVGVVLMLTRHPSYIPLELMACGSVTITNNNSWTEWLLKDGENCLLTPPTSGAIADTIEHALLNDYLRATISKNGIDLVKSHYLDWDAQMTNVFEYLCDPCCN